MNIAIIGAGPAGLAAAYDLTKAGHRVTLFEGAPNVGGLAAGFKAPHWEWTLDINTRAAWLATKHAVPLMRGRGGRIVNVSSLGSQRVLREYVLVGVSKAALESLTRYLAVELAPENIAVNAVAGGLVETDALRYFKNREAMLADARARTPAGRMLEPEDLARVIAFLCGPGADMIRGQTIVVDGGFSLPI